MKKLLLLSVLFLFFVACNNGEDNNSVNEIALNEQQMDSNGDFSNNVSDDNELAELDHQSVELIDVNQYTGVLKEHAKLINDYVTYQNNNDDESLSKIVGYPITANRTNKILKVEIDEELSYVRESEGLYIVEVNMIKSPGEKVNERSTSFVFKKIDDEWIIVND